MIAINLVGNLILIPRFGISGAAVVKLITESTGLVAGTLFIRARVVKLGYFRQLLGTLIIAGGSALPLLFLWSTHRFIGLTLFILAYLFLHTIAGVFNNTDKALVRQILGTVFLRNRLASQESGMQR